MDLNGLSSIYTDYMKTQSDDQRLEKMKADWKEKNKGTDDEQLMDACKQFEAYLWEQIYKEMEKAAKAFSDDEEGDAYAANMTDYFKESVIQQVSAQTADERSNSLAQLLYEQAKRNYDI